MASLFKYHMTPCHEPFLSTPCCQAICVKQVGSLNPTGATGCQQTLQCKLLAANLREIHEIQSKQIARSKTSVQVHTDAHVSEKHDNSCESNGTHLHKDVRRSASMNCASPHYTSDKACSASRPLPVALSRVLEFGPGFKRMLILFSVESGSHALVVR